MRGTRRAAVRLTEDLRAFCCREYRAPVVRITAGASSRVLRPLQPVCVHCAATAPRLVYNGQARRAVLVEFSASFFNRIIRTATSGRRSHDLVDANFGSLLVISRHTAAHVPLGDDADQLEICRILYYWRAAAA